ncbi:hypothetical protein EB796_012224 [Bugula neritina]|uniref:Uncharacterized protein n=1 Tax=Bugula neritina TaxID=10212 RepID=A0A7J7JUU3_BUGNE|nr:hypothetical protein EB796_012224 [Bugula neritina]
MNKLLLLALFVATVASTNAIKCYQCTDCAAEANEDDLSDCASYLTACYITEEVNGDTKTYHRGCSFAPANLEGDDCEKIVNPFVNDGIDHLRCHCDEDACNDKMKEITTTV